MTAHALKGDEERCLASGMDGYLSKPVNIEKVRQLIDELGRQPASHDISWDRDRALATTGGDDSLLAEAVELFLTECADSIAAIEQAISAHDAAAISATSHRLKGAAATLGAVEIASAAALLERNAQALDLAYLQPAWRHLQDAFARAKPGMEEFCGGLRENTHR